MGVLNTGNLINHKVPFVVMDSNRTAQELAATLPAAAPTDARPTDARSSPHSKAIVAASVHQLGLSIATLIASVEIHSILISGWICSCSGIIAGIFAAWAGRWRSFVTLIMTPILAICLVVVESIIRLGPDRAAIPFSIVFLVHQTVSSILLIGDLRPYRVDAEDQLSGKYTIRTLLVLMVLVAVFFSLYRLAIKTSNAACVGMALILVVLNAVGNGVAYIRHRVRQNHTI